MKLFTTLLTLVFKFGITSIQASEKKPNILFILADDLGYNDLSIHGCKQFQVPHIDSVFMYLTDHN
ncbi:Dna-J like membrane chaperone protein [Lentisphaera araneosa HTCC2155]|uniref:Dna-J like membrane chaperone protein n=1 Tax=Lentisphaera araneosa HTCC2155 TaxID=313628 RepID=A6DI24_9BACT|nr:hypothetical protein [Lentisphaera araneosa]EDM28678.1 Dna-J like membrane chaperone protein [Lentisphaera araneosa HTCC2155]